MRHAIRVPLYTRVSSDLEALGPLYCWNVSEGGMHLRAPEAPVGLITRGGKLALSYVLPDPSGGRPMHVTASVMWIDERARDHQGRRSLALGVKFEDGQSAEVERM